MICRLNFRRQELLNASLHAERGIERSFWIYILQMVYVLESAWMKRYLRSLLFLHSLKTKELNGLKIHTRFAQSFHHGTDIIHRVSTRPGDLFLGLFCLTLICHLQFTSSIFIPQSYLPYHISGQLVSCPCPPCIRRNHSAGHSPADSSSQPPHIRPCG